MVYNTQDFCDLQHTKTEIINFRPAMENTDCSTMKHLPEPPCPAPEGICFTVERPFVRYQIGARSTVERPCPRDDTAWEPWSLS